MSLHTFCTIKIEITYFADLPARKKTVYRKSITNRYFGTKLQIGDTINYVFIKYSFINLFISTIRNIHPLNYLELKRLWRYFLHVRFVSAHSLSTGFMNKTSSGTATRELIYTFDNYIEIAPNPIIERNLTKKHVADCRIRRISRF